MRLSGEFVNNWTATTTQAFTGKAADQKQEVTPPPIFVDHDPRQTVDQSQAIVWHGLEAGRAYILRVRFGRRGEDSGDVERALRLAKEGSRAFAEAEIEQPVKK